ncbi:hypothetical protein [Flavobacterium sp.]|uniref:hypothetical protein n=1 Tax=Flavobacterium sp. TaxID=239 RepID=UPI002609FBAD|nr:hypothetical protein [Flavobacterium sp.]
MKKLIFISVMSTLISCIEKKSQRKASTIFETVNQKEISVVSKSLIKSKILLDVALENTIISVIKSYQKKDERALNRLINKDLGIVFLFRMGAYDNLSFSKFISFAKPVPQYLTYANKIETDYVISKSSLPVFSCDTENWDKPPGIYIDTTYIDHSLSENASIENKLNDEKIWSDSLIEKLKRLENKSHKIIAIGKNKIDFVFYLVKINDEWYLWAIDRNEVCSA